MSFFHCKKCVDLSFSVHVGNENTLVPEVIKANRAFSARPLLCLGCANIWTDNSISSEIYSSLRGQSPPDSAGHHPYHSISGSGGPGLQPSLASATSLFPVFVLQKAACSRMALCQKAILQCDRIIQIDINGLRLPCTARFVKGCCIDVLGC